MSKQEAIRIATALAQTLGEVHVGVVERVQFIPAEMKRRVGNQDIKLGSGHDVWSVTFSYVRSDGALDGANLIVVEVDVSTKTAAFMPML